LAWLFSRSDNAEFVLRFDDLDHGSVRPEHYQSQIDDLRAIGLDWDGPIVCQSERQSFYQPALAELAADDLLYPCFCTRREVAEAAAAPNNALAGHSYPGTCANLDTAGRALRAEQLDRPPSLRIRSGDVSYGFNDVIAGPVEYQIDDFIIQRFDDTPAYHLVTVIDDADAGVELVVRADDLLDSTARQLLLIDLLGLASPGYAHVPLVLGPDGRRLAKRHGGIHLDDWDGGNQDPKALVGFLAQSLGIRPDVRPATPAELVPYFNAEAITKQPLTLAP